MRIAITGGTGFIGRALSAYLAKKGHTVYVLSRSNHATTEGIHYIQWRAENESFPLPSIDAVINLAGESINSGRWTKKRKERILTSRICTTKGIIRQLAGLTQPPEVFINASAIGYYGTSLTETFTERHLRHGNDFLANTVVAWEQEAAKAEELGIRTVYTRFGIVLGNNGGALPKMLLPYQLFIGGTVGSGKQWMSWVHLDDVVRMITFALETAAIRGPLNITAPHPVTMKEFGQVIAKVMKKPHWIPVPSLALKLLLGEMSTLILEGQKVLPEKALHNGYIYSYANLEEALMNILH